MQPTGGSTTALSPDDCQTAIDAVMWETYDRDLQPDYLSVRDGLFFKQGDMAGKIAFIWDEDSNVGGFDQLAEQEDFHNTDTLIGNQKVVRSQKWGKQIPLSDEFFRTDQHGLRARIGQQVGDRARLFQDKFGILNTYGDAFAGSVNTTPDGQALASDSHTTLAPASATVDNLETGALTPDNLWTVTQSLANQKAQDGEAGSHVFEALLVPFILYKTSKEVLESTLIPNSGENNLNFFDTVYGQVSIKSSIFLGSTYNTNSNANTSYHVLGRNHMIMRKTLYDMQTTMIPPEYTSNDTYVYRAKYHEVTFPGSWTAYVGSNGTTA